MAFFADIDWENLIANLGVPSVLVLGLAALVWKYAPKLVSAHLDFVNASAEAQPKITAALEVSAGGHTKTHEALVAHADAMQVIADAHGGDVSKEVKKHVDAIKRVLE